MSKKKVSQHEDGFESVEQALTKTEQYIEENQKSLTIIIAAIIVVVGGYLSYKNFYLAPKEKEAQEEMFMAERYFEQDSFQLALEGDISALGFLDIIDEYGITKTADLAYYYAGICYLRTGQYEEAIEYLKQFDSNDRLVSSIALGAIGDAYVELDNLKEGVAFYEKAAENTENGFTSPIYLKKAGIVYEKLEEYEKAINAYKTIKIKYPESDEAKDIDKYIAAAETHI